VNQRHLRSLTADDLKTLERWEEREIFGVNQEVERVDLIQSFKEWKYKFHAEVVEVDVWFDYLITKINGLYVAEENN
jgi:hypothetical protein